MGKMKALTMEMEEYQEIVGRQAIEEQREMEPPFPESSAEYDKRLERDAMFNGTTHQDFDPVNKPKHYEILPGLEVYDLRQAYAKKLQGIVPLDQFSDWDRGLEYLLRMWEKNGREDLEKALIYLNLLLKKLPKEVHVSGVPYKVPSSSILGSGV